MVKWLASDGGRFDVTRQWLDSKVTLAEDTPLGALLLAQPCAQAAEAVFNAVVYGDRSATPAQAEAVRALDARLRAAAAAPVSPAGGGGAGASTPGVPR